MGGGQSKDEATKQADEATKQAEDAVTQAEDAVTQAEEDAKQAAEDAKQAERQVEESNANIAATETEQQKQEAITRQEEAKKRQEEAAAVAKEAEATKAKAKEAEEAAKANAEAIQATIKAEAAKAAEAEKSMTKENRDQKPKAKVKLELFNIHMSLTNILQYVSFSSPLLLVFFITLYSIVENNYLSGLIFNMGIVIISSIVYILKHVLKNKQQDDANPFCNVLPSPFSVRAYDENIGPHYYDSPSFSSAVLSFSATYLVYPMFINPSKRNNGLLVFSIVLVLINAVTEFLYKCSGVFGIVLGILLGIIFAILYYSLLASSEYSNKYLYFLDPISNNVQCSKPGNQNFKCKLYKNGEAIGQI